MKQLRIVMTKDLILFPCDATIYTRHGTYVGRLWSAWVGHFAPPHIREQIAELVYWKAMHPKRNKRPKE